MRQNPEEVVFSVSGSTAVSASVITLAEAGLREREHLQEWVLAHPEIIGPDVMVVMFEFDQWTAAAGPPKDRLDILGLGRDGRLVVAELKRDRAPDTVDMQAVKYAAMASRFTLERLAHYHSVFTQHRYGAADGEQALNEDEASAKLETWAGGALLPEQLVNPRVVLLAESFPPTVTATAVWLNERGVGTGGDPPALDSSRRTAAAEPRHARLGARTGARTEPVGRLAGWQPRPLPILAAVEAGASRSGQLDGPAPREIARNAGPPSAGTDIMSASSGRSKSLAHPWKSTHNADSVCR